MAHGGGTNGQISTFQMIPERDFALVVLTNSDTGGVLDREIAQRVHERVLSLTEPEPEMLDLSTEARSEYLGTYEREMITLEVQRKEKGLEVDARLRKPPEGWEQPIQLPPTPIGFYDSDRLIALDGLNKGGRGAFIRNSDGGIEWLRWGGRIHRRTG